MRANHDGLRTRLQLEHLEDRTVPTTVNLTAGTLTVFGTGNGEQIDVTQSGGTIQVSGVTQTFNAADVKLLTIDAADGDDVVTVGSLVTAPTWIFGGGGNDRITGGGGSTFIYAGSGNDTITGGSGVDTIFGGAGTNSVSAQVGDTVTSGTAYESASLSAVAAEVVQLTNQIRAQNGLAPLSYSGQLTAAAELHAKNMTGLAPTLGYNAAMAHTLMGAAQPTMLNRAAVVGYEYRALGENIGYGYSDAAAIVNAWMNSPGHRANILNSTYTQIGVAVSYTDSGMPYFAQAFGMPLAGNPTGPSPITTNPIAPPPPAPTPAPPPVVAPPPPVVAPPPPVVAPPPVETPTPPATNPTPPPTGSGQLYVTPNANGTVTVCDLATGTVKFTLQAYSGNPSGGVRVALGDITGDGKQDVVVAPGAGQAPVVKVFNGVNGVLVRSYYAYSPYWKGGVFVAVRDVNRDGRVDIVTSTDAAGKSNLRAFDGVSLRAFRSFFAPPNTQSTASVASGNANGDPAPARTSRTSRPSGSTMLASYLAGEKQLGCNNVFVG